MNLNGLTTDEQREMLTKLLQQKVARATRYPMSIGQQALWHAFRRDPGSTSFNVFLPTRMRALIDMSAMQQAIECVAARHVCLHTVFSDAHGELMQIVNRDLRPDIQIIELPAASDSQAREIIAREIIAREIIAREIEQPFNLEQGPLLRVRIVRLAADDCLILAMTHHIVVDFWSLIIILKELREAYPQFARGQLPKLPPAQNNYAQFVVEQQSFLKSAKGDQHRVYWQSVAEQAPSVIELATDRLRPAVFENRAENRLLEFPDSLVPQINSLAVRLKATPFSVLHSALQVFLSRYSDQKKFFIGCPFAGRSLQQYEQTVGFFINMLPLVADLEGDPTFVRLIERTSRNLFDALQHEAYPIAQIVHDARVPRDPSRSPLFQVSVTFEKSHVKSETGRAAFLFPNQQLVWDFGGLRQESYYVPHPTCHYDLEFIFEQTETKLRGMLVACRALFEGDTVATMAQNFSNLLQSLVEQADMAVSRVPWQTGLQPPSSQKRGLLQAGSLAYVHGDSQASPAYAWAISPSTIASAQSPLANELAASQTRTVCGLIEAVARVQPQQVALIFDKHHLSFSKMMTLARAVAAKVQHRLNCSMDGHNISSPGIQPLTNSLPIVPVCTDSGPLAFIGMLGVQLARAIPATIDLTQPAMDAIRLGHDTSAQVWLGHPMQTYLSHLSHLRPSRIVDLDCLLDPRASVVEATDVPDAITSLPLPSDVAYLVYTSGSTGKPKGVLVEHNALCNTLAWRKQTVPLTTADRVLMLLSHQFDAALGIAWSAMTQAATLVWAEPEAAFDPLAIIEQIIRDRITVLPAIPSLLRVLVSHPRFAQCTSLRLIFTGGEAMPPELPSQLRLVSKARIWNFYGPTEAAIEATACDVTEHSPLRLVPIGRPIDNTEILVLDQYQRPVPDTVPGELAIAGAGLARGYLNAPDLTRSKFVQLACDTRVGKRTIPAGARMYLTGDRGRRMPDGQIEFLGRTDHQIKLRGYRIELGEIEAILQSHPDVERAAVQVVSPGSPNAQLVATVSLRQSKVPQAHDCQALRPYPASPPYPSPKPTSALPLSQDRLAPEIKQFAAQHLPHNKVPTAIVIVDHMPLTSSGKVDRARLPQHPPTSVLPAIFVPPVTALEKFIAATWCDSLHIESLSINVNYFDAGGSSLGAAMLTSQLSQQLGIHVPTALLFDLADIGQVATRLAELHGPILSERFGHEAIVEQLARARQLTNAPHSSSDAPTSQIDPLHPLLAPLKTNGTLPPIFMVHPPGGIVICYRELAQQLDRDQPLYAIRARGLHGREALPETLEDMAADYLLAVRAAQPRGPYVLGGWSLGGLVAYEMAQQLLRSGEGLTSLILLDTTIPEGSTKLVPAAELVNVGLEYGIELTLDQLGELEPAEQLPFLWEHAKALGVIDEQNPPEVVNRVLEDLQYLFHHHVKLARDYRLEPLSANIELLRPTETPFELKVSPDRGWRHLAQSIRVHFVPGHHHSMVQPPHVQHVARVISATLLPASPNKQGQTRYE